MRTSFKLVLGSLLIWPVLSSSMPKGEDLGQCSTIDSDKDVQSVNTTFSELEGWEELVMAYDEAKAQFYNKLSNLADLFIKVALYASHQALRALGDTPNELKKANKKIFKLFGVDFVDPEASNNGFIIDWQGKITRLKKSIEPEVASELASIDNRMSSMAEYAYAKIIADIMEMDFASTYGDTFRQMMGDAKSLNVILAGTIAGFFKNIIRYYNTERCDRDTFATGHKYAIMASESIRSHQYVYECANMLTSAINVYTEALEAAKALSYPSNMPIDGTLAYGGVFGATPRPDLGRCKQTYILNHICKLLRALGELKKVSKKPTKTLDIRGQNDL